MTHQGPTAREWPVWGPHPCCDLLPQLRGFQCPRLRKAEPPIQLTGSTLPGWLILPLKHVIDPLHLFPLLPPKARRPLPGLPSPKESLLMHVSPRPTHSPWNGCPFQNARQIPSLTCLKHFNGFSHSLRVERKILPHDL